MKSKPTTTQATSPPTAKKPEPTAPKYKKPTRVTFWSDTQRQKFVDQPWLKRIGLPVLHPTIRSSGIGDFRTCARKYMLRYRLGLRARHYRSALNTGTYYHVAMAHLYRGVSPVDAGKATIAYFKADQDEILSHVDPTGMLPWGQTAEDFREKSRKDISVAIAMALWSWSHAPLDRSVWDIRDDGVEELIEIKYTGISAPIRVRIDAVLVHKPTNDIYFADHKTTSDLPSRRAQTLRWDLQPQLYRLALVTKYANSQLGDKVAGVIHNIIKKPTIRQRIKQGESFTEFLARMTETYEEQYQNARAGRGEYPFLQSTVNFTSEVVSEELLLSLQEAGRAARAKIHLARYPRNAQSCYTYNTACPYLPLCESPTAAWPSLIDSRFEVKSRDQEDMEK